MLVKLYSIKHDYRLMNKDLQNPLYKLNINILRSTDMLYPVLEVYSKYNLKNANYMYIDIFERYYFIERVDIIRNDFYRLKCKVDVLESYKDDILNTNEVVYSNSVKVRQQLLDATNTIQPEVHYILTTIGE